MRRYEGDGISSYPLDVGRGLSGMFNLQENFLFTNRDDGSIRFQGVLAEIIERLPVNLERFASISVGGDATSARLVHGSGTVRRLTHEPQAYGLISPIVSYLDQEHAYRDTCRLPSNSAKYIGTPLERAFFHLAKDGPDVDVFVMPPNNLIDLPPSELDDWRNQVNGAIFVSKLDAIRSFGYVSADWIHDIRGSWYAQRNGWNRALLTSSGIPGTKRWCYAISVYDVHQDEQRPPVSIIQTRLGPVSRVESIGDRRTGPAVNHRQQNFQTITRFTDGGVGILAQDLVAATAKLRLPDRLEELPDSLAKLAHTMIRMSRITTSLVFEDCKGVRFIYIPISQSDFDKFMIEHSTQEAIAARLEEAFRSGELGQALSKEQRAELITELFVLGPFFGPYFWRTFFALGGGYLIPGLEGYQVDWSSSALRDDAGEHRELEKLYRDCEPALLAGGPAAYQASRRIGSFCVNSTLARFRCAGLHVPDSRSSLLTK